MGDPSAGTATVVPPVTAARPDRLADLTPQQWKAGLAALGWLFDGLDMHLYVLVALPFVAELLTASRMDPADAGYYGSWIQVCRGEL